MYSAIGNNPFGNRRFIIPIDSIRRAIRLRHVSACKLSSPAAAHKSLHSNSHRIVKHAPHAFAYSLLSLHRNAPHVACNNCYSALMHKHTHCFFLVDSSTLYAIPVYSRTPRLVEIALWRVKRFFEKNVYRFLLPILFIFVHLLGIIFVCVHEFLNPILSSNFDLPTLSNFCIF